MRHETQTFGLVPPQSGADFGRIWATDLSNKDTHAPCTQTSRHLADYATGPLTKVKDIFVILLNEFKHRKRMHHCATATARKTNRRDIGFEQQTSHNPMHTTIILSCAPQTRIMTKTKIWHQNNITSCNLRVVNKEYLALIVLVFFRMILVWAELCWNQN